MCRDPCVLNNGGIVNNRKQCCPAWSKADAACLGRYREVLDDALKKVDIPSELFSDRVDDSVSHMLIDNYYCAVLSCITISALYALPTRKLGSAHTEYVVPS